MGVGEHEAREARRLIGQAREADDEAGLPDRVGELEATRQRERRVDARTEQEELDLAAFHGPRELHHLRVGRHPPVRGVGAEADRLADVPGRRIEQVDRDQRVRGVPAAHGDAAPDREPWPRVAED